MIIDILQGSVLSGRDTPSKDWLPKQKRELFEAIADSALLFIKSCYAFRLRRMWILKRMLTTHLLEGTMGLRCDVSPYYWRLDRPVVVTYWLQNKRFDVAEEGFMVGDFVDAVVKASEPIVELKLMKNCNQDLHRMKLSSIFPDQLLSIVFPTANAEKALDSNLKRTADSNGENTSEKKSDALSSESVEEFLDGLTEYGLFNLEWSLTNGKISTELYPSGH